MKKRAVFRQVTVLEITAAIISWLIFTAGISSAGSVSYTYDTLGRLTEAVYANNVIIDYVYDAAGNRSNTTVTGVLASPAILLESLSAPFGSETTTIKSTAVASAASAEKLVIGPLLLPTMTQDSAIFGWNGLSGQPQRTVAAVFVGDGTDRLLHLQGYIIDAPNEIGLWLNGTLLGYLSPVADGTLSPPSLWLLPVALQTVGENVVELIPRTENQVWGVTRLGFYTLGSVLGNQDGLTGGDPNYAEGFELHLFDQGPFHDTGVTVDLAWWDSNNDAEIAIDLNGAPLIELPQNNAQIWSPVYQLRITPETLIPGDNRLMIMHRYGALEPWGVRLERILPDAVAFDDKFPVLNGWR